MTMPLLCLPDLYDYEEFHYHGDEKYVGYECPTWDNAVKELAA